MTATKRRIFRIEKYQQAQLGSRNQNFDMSGFQDNQQLMNAITELKDIILEQKVESSSVVETINSKLEQDETQRISEQTALDALLKEKEEAEKLKYELKEIYDAIEQTKQEILTIHQSGANGMEMSRVSDELGAIVAGTENATENILAAAEKIDHDAANLSAALVDESQQNLACDIQDQVIKIFEECNFQDLTGQRITKVVNAFLFVEQRVVRMMEIWGGVESFDDVKPADLPEREGDNGLLNGPALDKDVDVASQADIDALFD